MHNLYDIEMLPIFSEETRNYTSTSYCRKGSNKDYGTCLYREADGKYVIFDDMGYGMITKIFLPDINENAVLEFYFESEETPSVCASVKSIFSGHCEFFKEKFVYISNDFKSHKSGYSCYQPLIYDSRMLIKLVTDDDFFYYHIDYVKSNRSFANVPTEYAPSLRRCEYDVKYTNKEKSETEKIAMGKSEELISVSAMNAVVKNLRIKVPGIQALKTPSFAGKSINNRKFKKSQSLLKNLYISINFSGKENVNVPFANFFGLSTFGRDRRAPEYHTKSLFFGADNDGFVYFKIPMPFSGTLTVRLINDSPFDLKKIDTEIFYDSNVENYESLMPFYATEINTIGSIRDRNDMRLIDLNGKGKYIGAVLDMTSDLPVRKGEYLEGDEHIFFDNSPVPQISGTGTEDYFCGAYYWQSGTQSTPFFGCMYNTKWADAKEDKKAAEYKSSACRVHLADSYTFRERFTFNLEHGGTNETWEKLKATLFYYLTDSEYKEIPVEVFSSEACEKTGKFEGELTNPPISICINTLQPGEKISFKLDNCQNAVLTRTFDYSLRNQCADVYVNGKFCGKWYDAGENPHCIFSSSEFILPNEALTEGAEVSLCAQTIWTFANMKAIVKPL